MAPPPKSLLWVDDEAELLEPHRMFLRDKGFEIEAATNAEDALDLVRRRPFDLVLLDEQMPGRRGLDAIREIRELAATMPIVMVTKSEEDATLNEALGTSIAGYLVKPVTPRQVFALVNQLLEGPRLRQQAVAREFAGRFRELQYEGFRDLDWRGWIDRYAELVRWDVDLASADEPGLYDSLQRLYPDMHRAFAGFMAESYPRWLRELDGDRPPLSIDVVAEFLMPAVAQHGAALFVIIDALRLDQWRVLEPHLQSMFDIETTHYYAVLPTATPFSRNALFSGLFPAEIAARHPDWWGEREDETLNAHERQLLVAQLQEMGKPVPVRYDKISTQQDAAELERRGGTAVQPEGISAFVFNFVDLLTHGRSESALLNEIAKDEIALRALTEQWFRRSVLFSILQEAARRRIPVIITTDHGSIHCHTPATVFAKRDATSNLRYKFGEDLRAEEAALALQFRNEDALKLPRRGLGANTLLATGDAFFVYPTKLREYQRRYSGSFLHGGVTPEECILPVSLLMPK